MVTLLITLVTKSDPSSRVLESSESSRSLRLHPACSNDLQVPKAAAHRVIKGPKKIRIGFGCPLYYNYHKEPSK